MSRDNRNPLEMSDDERRREERAINLKLRRKAHLRRKLREQIYRDLGMVRVRGALGGTYYE